MHRARLWKRAMPEERIQRSFDKHVSDLIRLHGSKGNPLRYPDESSQTKAPPPYFIVKVLHRTADDFRRRPMDFRIKG